MHCDQITPNEVGNNPVDMQGSCWVALMIETMSWVSFYHWYTSLVFSAACSCSSLKVVSVYHHIALLFRTNSTTYCSDTVCIPPNHCCMYWVSHSPSVLISCPDLNHAMKLIWKIIITIVPTVKISFLWHCYSCCHASINTSCLGSYCSQLGKFKG